MNFSRSMHGYDIYGWKTSLQVASGPMVPWKNHVDIEHELLNYLRKI